VSVRKSASCGRGLRVGWRKMGRIEVKESWRDRGGDDGLW